MNVTEAQRRGGIAYIAHQVERRIGGPCARLLACTNVYPDLNAILTHYSIYGGVGRELRLSKRQWRDSTEYNVAVT